MAHAGNPCCLLHTRRYRAVFENLINELSETNFPRHRFAALRVLQRSELCICPRSAVPEPAPGPAEVPAAADFHQGEQLRSQDQESSLEQRADCNDGEWGGCSEGLSTSEPQQAAPEGVDSGYECLEGITTSASGTAASGEQQDTDVEWVRVAHLSRKQAGLSPRSLSSIPEALVQAAQNRLEAIARKQGQLEELELSIRKVAEVVRRATHAAKGSTANSGDAKDGNKATPATNSRRMAKYLLYKAKNPKKFPCRTRRTRFIRRMSRPPAPEPKPYAPLRWPPARVTMARLRGEAPPQPTATLFEAVPQRVERPGRVAAHVAEYLELAEEFEDKLCMARGSKRRSGAGTASKKGGGAGGLKLQPIRSAGEGSYSLRIAPDAKQRLGPRPAGWEDRPRREFHRGSVQKAASKGAVDVAEYWPYK